MNTSDSVNGSLFQADSRAALIGMLILVAAYILPGLTGHDPWKQDEAYSFGIIYNMVLTGDLIVPTLAADPFMEKPPAYYITATGMVHLFDGLLPMHDAARLTTGLFLALTFLFTGLMARAAWGNGFGAVGVLVLMSTMGLMQHGHFMITDTALTAGMSMACFGLLQSRTRAGWGGVWLGSGAGLSFMSKGLLGPGIIGISSLLLPVLSAQWRTGTYFKALAVAFAAALPWIVVWPTALYLRDHDLFMRWFWDNNLGRFLGGVELGPPAQEGFWLRTFPWVTFPAFPLALWTLWILRGRAFTNPGVIMAVIVSAIGWTVLFISHTARDLYAMPLLPVLALLGAGALSQLPRCMNYLGYWSGILLFGLIAIFLWILWIYGILAGEPPQWRFLDRQLPLDFEPDLRWRGVLAALALQAGWAWLLWKARPPRVIALIAWPTGMILGWALVTTLHLTWLDQAKSYRGVFTELREQLPENPGCVADLKSRRLRESERGLLHYMAGITTEHIETPAATLCDWIIAELRLPGHDPGLDLGQGWRRVWQGHRPGDRRDLFILFRRTES